MYTFLLIVSSSQRPVCAGDLINNLGRIRSEPRERYVVEGPGGMHDGWIAIQPIGGIDQDYTEEEIRKIKEYISEPCFFLVEGRDGKTKFSNKFVLNLNNPDIFLLDNDHGLIDRAKRIQERIIAGVDWLNTTC